MGNSFNDDLQFELCADCDAIMCHYDLLKLNTKVQNKQVAVMYIIHSTQSFAYHFPEYYGYNVLNDGYITYYYKLYYIIYQHYGNIHYYIPIQYIIISLQITQKHMWLQIRLNRETQRSKLFSSSQIILFVHDTLIVDTIYKVGLKGLTTTVY